QNTLLFSAVKNGHTDIFSFKIDKPKLEQLTNDVYDDLDPSFVSFPNKSGIIFSSNRPGPDAPSSDTVLPSNYRYNIFLLDYFTKKQITQLTNLKFGNGRFPTQYNVNHFTYVSDENGIGNRWAGFFTTQREGLDTLFYIGDEVLRNPSDKELDSTMVAWQKNEPDSISMFAVTKDSTYTFPITNYQSSLLETRIAGDRGQVSEVIRQGDLKYLYKLRVDSLTLRRRNVNARPTEFRKKEIAERRIQEGKASVYQAPDTTKATEFFQNEFQNEASDSGAAQLRAAQTVEPVLQRSKLYNYRLKFSTDNVVSGISNNILINRYQPYGGGNGPIQLGNGANVNFAFRATISDLLEDYKLTGGFRLGTNLSDKDYLFAFQNVRKRFDWGVLYYKSINKDYGVEIVGAGLSGFYDAQLNTNIYQANVAYPLNEVKSLRANVAYRVDRTIIKAYNNSNGPDPIGLSFPDQFSRYALTRFEYVHDNTIYPTQNIWNGLRYKVYMDVNLPVMDKTAEGDQYTFNFGFDARNYVPIYRNIIWATRAAADASWGNRKLIYYLGGVDGWINPKFNRNPPDPDQTYAFQTLAVNLRGFKQNVANGNNALVINSEVRVPVFSSFLNKPINNAFIRNFQLVQFIDLGAAWNGKYDKIERPSVIHNVTNNSNPITVRVKAGGIGPLAGGYGFGARSTLLGYFLKFDTAWEMNGIFKGRPTYYFALGLDF
ncbi:MAG: D-alanyl-D-alanine carboxypeptidase, partial [Segetibacter sp.]|nr:D-alanyl-D-alanine carboxypeptidase [Segetibacter sp.]